MNIKNIKSFIEFYKILGITDCISQLQRNITETTVEHKQKHRKMRKTEETNKKFETKLEAINNLKSQILNLDCNL
jgi:septal ring factor EnvC (AmiA/AmiB activator)